MNSFHLTKKKPTPSIASAADTTPVAVAKQGRPKGTEKRQVLRAQGAEEYRKLKKQDGKLSRFDNEIEWAKFLKS